MLCFNGLRLPSDLHPAAILLTWKMSRRRLALRTIWIPMIPTAKPINHWILIQPMKGLRHREFRPCITVQLTPNWRNPQAYGPSQVPVGVWTVLISWVKSHISIIKYSFRFKGRNEPDRRGHHPRDGSQRKSELVSTLFAIPNCNLTQSLLQWFIWTSSSRVCALNTYMFMMVVWLDILFSGGSYNQGRDDPRNNPNYQGDYRDPRAGGGRRLK